MNSVDIIYRIKLSQDRVEDFTFRLDEENFDLISEPVAEPPPWTRLDYRQCPHCPLSPEEHTHCPLALQIYSIVDRFHDTRSIDDVVVEVITEERRVRQRTALQRVIASMLDLIYPICGCPKTAFMKPCHRTGCFFGKAPGQPGATCRLQGEGRRLAERPAHAEAALRPVGG